MTQDLEFEKVGDSMAAMYRYSVACAKQGTEDDIKPLARIDILSIDYNDIFAMGIFVNCSGVYTLYVFK